MSKLYKILNIFVSNMASSSPLYSKTLPFKWYSKAMQYHQKAFTVNVTYRMKLLMFLNVEIVNEADRKAVFVIPDHQPSLFTRGQETKRTNQAPKGYQLITPRIPFTKQSSFPLPYPLRLNLYLNKLKIIIYNIYLYNYIMIMLQYINFIFDSNSSHILTNKLFLPDLHILKYLSRLLRRYSRGFG